MALLAEGALRWRGKADLRAVRAGSRCLLGVPLVIINGVKRMRGV
jgi:hypothetical protein